MSKPAAVAFDYGQVLSLPQSRTYIKAMAELLGPEFQQHYWDLREPYDRGDILGDAYWSAVVGRCGVPFSTELCRELIELDVLSWGLPNMTMVQMAARLKADGVKLAIISNLPFELRASLASVDSWLPQFDHQTFSCEVGCVKPGRKIYDHCLRGLNLPAEKVLFVDDRQENIDAAKKIGMQTVWAVDAAVALEEIAKIFNLQNQNV
jgi:putative hydrolase of the HAD superfamily